MEAMAERDYEELLEVDLVPKRSPHHTLSDFGGIYHNESKEEGGVQGEETYKMELAEVVMEKVVNKMQETHDLFCPNCNSCITNRVIIRPRKMKRKIREISPRQQIQEKLVSETTVESTEGDDAFECLSCFTIFIPIERGFKLIFGGRDSKESNPVSNEADETAISIPETETNIGTTNAIPITESADSKLDIMKSIVYGGLLESIASLSVVASAAAADANTLNIVALGAANMFGGLLVLANNLRVMKNETSNEHYEEVLGWPEHFTLHSMVALVSYLVFGLLPPITYGFTFIKSDNKDYKLIAVASASFLCILLLALAKAHTRAQPRTYKKTLLYYVTLWVMVCGVSYVVGDLLGLLLQKLRLFDSSVLVAMVVGKSTNTKTPWASY